MTHQLQQKSIKIPFTKVKYKKLLTPSVLDQLNLQKHVLTLTIQIRLPEGVTPAFMDKKEVKKGVKFSKSVRSAEEA